MDYLDILQKLKEKSHCSAVLGGVSVPRLRELANEIGQDHALAQKLWHTDCRETRILASMTEIPEMVTEEQVDNWAAVFDCREICDLVCDNLFSKTPFAYKKSFQWAHLEKEFIKRAGFVLMERLAASDTSEPDAKFMLFLSSIKQGATDERPNIIKAVNRALCQIGKRSYALNKMAIEVADEISLLSSRSAKWIAGDALRELTSDSVQNSLPAPPTRMIIYAVIE